MALRSLVRKMPALGLRPPPMGPLTGPLRALSPAAGSRLMSHGAPAIVDRLRPEIYSEDEMARARETVKRLRAEYDRNQAELEKQSAEQDRILELVKQDVAASEASYNEAARHIAEDRKRLMKDFQKIDKILSSIKVHLNELHIWKAYHCKGWEVNYTGENRMWMA